jgi:hypothetical protein
MASGQSRAYSLLDAPSVRPRVAARETTPTTGVSRKYTMSILKQALAEAQEALMESREALSNHVQATALADQMLRAYAGRSFNALQLAARRRARAELDFRVQTIDLFVCLFEAAAVPAADEVGVPVGAIQEFAGKLLEVQAARKQVIAHTF